MITNLLIRLFVPDCQNPEKPDVRASYGIFSGYTGIVVNVFLFLLKLVTGLLSGSVAIAADAVNNLSDAGSSVVTVFGFKLSSKPADSDHPFGHGRIEYIAGVIVAVIIIAMGLDFLKESVLRIITPEPVNMNPILIWLIAGSLLFKLWLFFFYRYIGKKINSEAVLAASFDSLSDMVGTTVILIAVICSRFTVFPVDGCAGALVAFLILLGGAKVLRDTINPLLGEPPSKEIVKELQNRLLQCQGIKGVHDIIIHNYGPNQYFATAHAEVEMEDDILSVHDMLENAEVEIGKNLPIHLLLHCDPYNPTDPEVKEWRVRMEDVVAEFDQKFKVYDFRMKKDNGKIILSYHVLIPRNYHLSYEKIHEALTAGMKKYPPSPELQIEFMHSYV